MNGFISDATEPNVGEYLKRHTNLSDSILMHLRQRGERVALLKNIKVQQGTRGQGCGSDLLDKFCQAAEMGGATAYMLIYDEDEVQAPGFDLVGWYNALGFSTVFTTSQGPLMVIPDSLPDSLADFLSVEEDAEDVNDDEPGDVFEP